MASPETRVNSTYGAPMGRRDTYLPGLEGDDTGRFTLRRVRLDSGGYDPGGAYWGHAEPLYWYAADTEHGQVDGYVRARTRERAKAEVRECYPDARFYR